MAHIKLNLLHKSSEEGDLAMGNIRHLSSDMANERNYDVNLIMHALASENRSNNNESFAYDFGLSF